MICNEKGERDGYFDFFFFFFIFFKLLISLSHSKHTHSPRNAHSASAEGTDPV